MSFLNNTKHSGFSSMKRRILLRLDLRTRYSTVPKRILSSSWVQKSVTDLCPRAVDVVYLLPELFHHANIDSAHRVGDKIEEGQLRRLREKGFDMESGITRLLDDVSQSLLNR